MSNRFAWILIASALCPAAPALAQPASPPPAPSPWAAGPDEAQARAFVQSYAAATRDRQMIARWGVPVCVRVSGLAAEQAGAVKARVEAVAEAVGVTSQAADCRPNVDIQFSNAPQGVLDDIVAHKAWMLGDATSDTRTARAVTLPIQAWYQTNGVEFAANNTGGGLKLLAQYQAVQTQPVQPLQGDSQQQWVPPVGETAPGAPRLQARQFATVMVIVDLRRTGKTDLGLISDDVAMLALAQPKALGRCNALPSVTDLYAGACPGRAAPRGLTATDSVYLAALYAADPVGRVFVSQQDGIVARMVRPQLGPAQRAVLANQDLIVRPAAVSTGKASAYRFRAR